MSIFKKKRKLSKYSFTQQRIYDIATSGGLFKYRDRTLKIMSFIFVMACGVLISAKEIKDENLRDILINISTEAIGISVTLYIAERIWKSWYTDYQRDKHIIDRYKNRKHKKYTHLRRTQIYRHNKNH